ncbi:unnamed protein product [Cylindrotheca closterium]|uniref:AAA+ ATPase domain-containing protein n=1 Tax=Cylindrotheca closterium TaxID=2856 RepID=A0AAD2FZ56_9STRA|nr:unnamed protein product [Cylindrotheca closterium]
MVAAVEHSREQPLGPFSLPPPRKILRRGTAELETALQQGEVELSLPQHELVAWMGWDDGQVSNGKKVDTSKEESVQCILEVGTQNSPQCDGNSENIEGKVEEHSHTSKAQSNCPKKRKRHEKHPNFCDIIGHRHVKLRLEEVLLPLALPSHLADSILTGIRANPTSIFMYGPPGCGKTELAKALAEEAEAAFLPVGPSDILSKFVGESEASIRSLFQKAAQEADKMNSKCAVLFFDELDALGQARGGHGTSNMEQTASDGCSRRVLAELLIQLNRINTVQYSSTDRCHNTEFTTCENESSSVDAVSCTLQHRLRIIIVAATNRPEDCDPALVRRFSIRVVVGLPSLRDRRRIVNRLLKGIETSISREQLGDIAAATDGWSGADLEHLTREAAMAPVRECIQSAALQKHRPRSCPKQTRNDIDIFPESSQTKKNDCQSRMQQEKLLEHFRNLRRVTYQDFVNAITFWMHNQNPNTYQPDCGRESPTSIALTACSSDEDD